MLVKELISDKSKWCQGFVARDGNEYPVPAQSHFACKWCLTGGITVCYSTNDRYQVKSAIERAIEKLFPSRFAAGQGYIPAFNDGATWEEIHAVLEEAGV